MQENKNTPFDYTYTAPTEEERKAVESIRRKYMQTEDKTSEKLKKMKALDEKIKNTATIWGLILGIVGTLLFGFGLSLILEWNDIVWGSVVAVIGLIPVGVAYPVYQKIFARGKKKYGAQILALAEEILAEKSE